ncbi:beta-lactamase/transpeptidase-like protein [Crepidotus variabilis]|uniref:Beta-lactamase/transpeptidase-like protein n=1 Tax=Crepidotus variabilis TaxID=179855 RepID=A0A9P6JL69_9AGAR|nr:beta-lactamase/transpeptidase-like protein [Crepidotus variabilis]
MKIGKVWLVSSLIFLPSSVSASHVFGLSPPKSQQPFTAAEEYLITSETKIYAEGLLKRWNSPGLSLAAVRRDYSQASGWRHEFASFGIGRADGSPVTPDSVFAIASNSKLFLAVSVGLLIHNATLNDCNGKRLTWRTKMQDLMPEWGLMDMDAEHGATIQDLLSHRTGMPRHDFSYHFRDGSLGDMISKLRYLRPSAELRETFQYNNLMYSVLSYLPKILLNQSYPSYVSQHIFNPLNMTASTFSVAEAEKRGSFVDGFQYDMEDIPNGKNGTQKPTVPYLVRAGDEEAWAGPGGVLTSARDMALWMSMLLNEGKHPYTNATVIPKGVIEHVARGRSVADGGKPEFPELGPKVYGAGQIRYSYRGREIVEHGGHNPGYRTQVARLPEDNLGVISMSNDDVGGPLMESVKWRIIDDALGLQKIDWNSRYEKVWNDYLEKARKHTPRPKNPEVSRSTLVSLTSHTFGHPTYGTLKPCFVPGSVLPFPENTLMLPEQPHCTDFLSLPPTQRLLADTNLTSPTFLIPFDVGFATHLLLKHFDGNIFNLTAVLTNWAAREEYKRKHGSIQQLSSQGLGQGRDRGDLVLRWLETFEAEWIDKGENEQGLAFRGGFWGKEGPDARSPEGTGKHSAEVWFDRVNNK